MSQGVEWIIDARGCDPARLADPATLGSLVDTIVRELDLRVLGEPLWHIFPGAGGITGLYLLAESHLTVHTFPEHASLCLNLFCCRERPEWDFTRGLGESVGAREILVRRIVRQYADSSAHVIPSEREESSCAAR